MTVWVVELVAVYEYHTAASFLGAYATEHEARTAAPDAPAAVWDERTGWAYPGGVVVREVPVGAPAALRLYPDD